MTDPKPMSEVEFAQEAAIIQSAIDSETARLRSIIAQLGGDPNADQ